MELGTLIESTLKLAGVTPETIQRWVGCPCHCRERVAKLNRLSRWARNAMAGKLKNPLESLRELIRDPIQ